MNRIALSTAIADKPAPHPDVDINACLEGEAPAWQAFMDRYLPILRKAVLWTLGRRGPAAALSADVDDVVQDVLVRLVRGNYRLLATYDPRRSSLATWLCVVARSAALDHLRDKRRGATVPLDECDEPRAEDAGLEEALTLPKEVLTPRQRCVLRLAVERDMDALEIARVMDIHPQTVRSLKHNALARLREYYSDWRAA